MAPSGLRIVAVTQSDPFFTGPFFEAFLAAAPPEHIKLVEVVLLPNFGESRLALLRRMAGLYPPPDFARLCSRYVRAQIDDRRGRGRSVEAVAARHGIPILRLRTINDPAYLATLSERGVDVLLSVAAPEIFRAHALRAAPRTLNVHSGRLPNYRGMMPIFWALLNGDDHVVVTVHEMAERVDAGAVIAEYRVGVERTESTFDVMRKAKVVAGRQVAALLATPATEEAPRLRPVDPGRGAYYSFPTRRDVRRLGRTGRRLS